MEKYCFPMARPDAAMAGTVAQEFAALLFEARGWLKAIYLEMMEKQGSGKKPYWMAGPIQVTPIVKDKKEFLAADKDAAEAAEKLCHYARDCAAAINELVGHFSDPENLEPADAASVCKLITDLCCTADRDLRDIQRQVAALEIAKQSACENIELRLCQPHPCAGLEWPGLLKQREVEAAALAPAAMAPAPAAPAPAAPAPAAPAPAAPAPAAPTPAVPTPAVPTPAAPAPVAPAPAAPTPAAPTPAAPAPAAAAPAAPAPAAAAPAAPAAQAAEAPAAAPVQQASGGAATPRGRARQGRSRRGT
jgi:cell division septation protein DedD